MSTSLQVVKRRQEVCEALLKGLKPHEIAIMVHVSRKTVDRDLVDINRNMGKRFKEKKIERILGKFEEKMGMRLKRYWKIIIDEDASNPDKIRALDSLRDEDKEAIRRLQIVGVIPKEFGTGIDDDSSFKGGRINKLSLYNIVMNIKEVQKEEQEKKEVIDVNTNKVP